MKRQRNEAAIDVIYRHYHNIVERSETVVIQIRIIASRGGFNGGLIEIWSFFATMVLF